MKKFLCFVLSSTFLPFYLSTCIYAGVGTTGAQFLKISPSARASGLGGAFSAFNDDVFAISYNPSGLASLESAQLAATYLSYFADVNFGYIGYVDPQTKVGAIGFGITYLIVDKMEKRDAKEMLIPGGFNAKDIALTFAYAKKDALPSVMENLSVGGAMKLISSEIDQTMAYTAALDLSASYLPNPQITTVLAVENISWGIRFKEVTDPLPLNLKLAGAYALNENLKVGLDINQYLIDAKFYASLGGEYWLADRKLALRLGYKYGYDTSSLGSIVGLAAGLGFRIWGAGVDYAFVPFGDLGNTHRASFSMKF